MRLPEDLEQLFAEIFAGQNSICVTSAWPVAPVHTCS